MLHKSKNEEDYFIKMEFERKKKIEDERRKNLEKQERESLKKLHHMCCPKCGMHLLEIDYKDIKIDKCSHCKGVWLDAGELDELLSKKENVLSKFNKIFK